MTADTPAATYPAGIELKLTGMADEFRVKYSLALINASDKDIGNVEIAVPMPTSARFFELTTTPDGAAVKGKPETSVVWTLGKLAARSSTGPFEFKVSVADKTAGPATGKATWTSPTASNVSSAGLDFAKIGINLPKRGCTSCHELRDEKTGSVTIAYEAKVRGGPNHPQLPWDTTVSQCLACHKPGTGDREGMGAVAPKMLRDIVHPAHLNSPSFTGTYKGNCFTCHNVDGKGNFTLLGEKVKTDFRGIPAEVPVKSIPPSEGGK